MSDWITHALVWVDVEMKHCDGEFAGIRAGIEGSSRTIELLVICLLCGGLWYVEARCVSGPLPGGIRLYACSLSLVRYFSPRSGRWEWVGVGGRHHDSRAMKGSGVESVTSRFPAVDRQGDQQSIPGRNGALSMFMSVTCLLSPRLCTVSRYIYITYKYIYIYVRPLSTSSLRRW